MDLLLLAVGAVLVNNFVLSRFLGICPFLGVSKQFGTALGMSGAVVFVMTLASVVSWLLYHGILAPGAPLVAQDLRFLQILSFILIIAAMVQLVELALQKLSPPLYQSLGIYLPLITTNCAVLGVAVLNIQNGHTLAQTALFGFAGALGFALAILLFSGIREVLDLADAPRAFKGTALALAFVQPGFLALELLDEIGRVRGVVRAAEEIGDGHTLAGRK